MGACRCAHTSSTGDRESSVTAQGYPRRLRSTRHCTRRGWSRAGAAQFASAECRGARAPSACRSYGRSRVQTRTHRMKHRLYPITTLVASIHFADVLGSRALRGTWRYFRLTCSHMGVKSTITALSIIWVNIPPGQFAPPSAAAHGTLAHLHRRPPGRTAAPLFPI